MLMREARYGCIVTVRGLGDNEVDLALNATTSQSYLVGPVGALARPCRAQ
jgi:hypothetical protein